MANAELYATTRTGLYEELFNRAFDTEKQNRLRAEADSLWLALSEEERREAELGYFAKVQAYNKGDCNYRGPRQM